MVSVSNLPAHPAYCTSLHMKGKVGRSGVNNGGIFRPDRHHRTTGGTAA